MRKLFAFALALTLAACASPTAPQSDCTDPTTCEYHPGSGGYHPGSGG